MNERIDVDPLETTEWLDALLAIKNHRGKERARYVIASVVDAARRDGLYTSRSLTTPYCNTIPVDEQPPLPGDRATEHKLRSAIRWNALAIVLRANKDSWTYRELSVRGYPLRHRLWSFLARAN